MSDVILSQEEFGILVTCATRYAIGRQSYMPYLPLWDDLLTLAKVEQERRKGNA